MQFFFSAYERIIFEQYFAAWQLVADDTEKKKFDPKLRVTRVAAAARNQTCSKIKKKWKRKKWARNSSRNRFNNYLYSFVSWRFKHRTSSCNFFLLCILFMRLHVANKQHKSKLSPASFTLSITRYQHNEKCLVHDTRHKKVTYCFMIY